MAKKDRQPKPEQMGHNAVTQAGEQLMSVVARVERLDETIKELNQDKKEVYGEARATGFDTKTIKKVVQRRRMDRSQCIEADTLLELYESVINADRAVKADPLE